MKPPGQGPPAQTSTDRSQPTRHSHSILLGQCQGDDVYKAQGVSRGFRVQKDHQPQRGDRRGTLPLHRRLTRRREECAGATELFHAEAPRTPRGTLLPAFLRRVNDDTRGDVDVVTYSVGLNPEMQTAPLRFGYDRLGRRNTIKTYLPGTNATWILSLPSPSPVSTLSQTDNDLDEPETESWSGGPLAGRSVTTSRDSFGRRQGVTTSVAHFQAQNVTAYDPAGRPAIIIAGNHTATYRYVANSRIRAGVTYRANGTQRLDTQYDFDRLNRLQQVLNQPSAAGQPAERHAYTYNAAQQRIRDELADGSSWSWESDPLGRRIGRIVSTGASGSWVPTSTTRWLYEGWNPVAELNGAGTLVREYVWGTDLSGGGPHGCRQSPAVEYEDPG